MAYFVYFETSKQDIVLSCSSLVFYILYCYSYNYRWAEYLCLLHALLLSQRKIFFCSLIFVLCNLWKFMLLLLSSIHIFTISRKSLHVL